MIALYVGIYRIALGLHRRSVAQRERSIACLVSMAGGAVTQIGSVIGMARSADGHGPSRTAVDAPATGAAAGHQQHLHDDDDDDDDEDDCPPTAGTPHVAGRLPTLLLPATSFALFGRLGASRHQDSHHSSFGCRKQTTSATNLPASSTEVRPDSVDKRLPPPVGADVKTGCSRSKFPSTLTTCLDGSGRATVEFGGDEQPSTSRRKRDAASAVAARPEDLHDLPFFDDDDDDVDYRPPDTLNAAGKPTEAEDAALTSSARASSLMAATEQRTVRFVAATEDVVMTGCSGTTTPHPEDAVLPDTSCNGDRRRLVSQLSSSALSSRLRQKRNTGFAGHVWRHVVVHKEGQHAESRLEKASEPDERQALLRASCPRHGGMQSPPSFLNT